MASKKSSSNNDYRPKGFAKAMAADSNMGMNPRSKTVKPRHKSK